MSLLKAAQLYAKDDSPNLENNWLLGNNQMGKKMLKLHHVVRKYNSVTKKCVFTNFVLKELHEGLSHLRLN